MQRFSRDKELHLTAVIIFVLSIAGIAALTFYNGEIVSMDMTEINEKNVSFFYVFTQNMLIISRMFLYGFMTCGIYTIFILIQNVASLGLICNSLFHNGYGELVIKMLPHGIIEIAVAALAVASVIKFWLTIIKSIPGVIKRENGVAAVMKAAAAMVLKTYVVCVLLLAVAGMVETIVSLYKVLG